MDSEARKLVVKVVVNAREKRAIGKRAKAAGMSASCFARVMLLRGELPRERKGKR